MPLSKLASCKRATFGHAAQKRLDEKNQAQTRAQPDHALAVAAQEAAPRPFAPRDAYDITILTRIDRAKKIILQRIIEVGGDNDYDHHGRKGE